MKTNEKTKKTGKMISKLAKKIPTKNRSKILLITEIIGFQKSVNDNTVIQRSDEPLFGRVIHHIIWIVKWSVVNVSFINFFAYFKRLSCPWCEIDALESFLQKECVSKSFLEISSKKNGRRYCNCTIFEFSYQTCSKMFVLLVVFVHVEFSCVHKLIAFEFQVLVLVGCSWDICSVFVELFFGNNRVVIYYVK